MKFTTVKFTKTCHTIRDLPEENVPQVVFSGKSNVGKSSLINTLLIRKIAHISKTPGKTRGVNFFLVNEKFYFVDLPGYGFSRVNKAMRRKWQHLIDSFFKKNQNIKLTIQIVDIRHEMTELDYLMLKYLEGYKIKYVIAATKADKLSRGKTISRIKELEAKTGNRVLAFSSNMKTGRKELMNIIDEHLTLKI